MRKNEKKKLLDCVDSLHKAHKEIKEAVQRKAYAAVQNMLSECQDFAVALGENIETLEGEGHITMSHVEEYCETLFRVFKEITDGEVNENKIYKILKRQLLNVENSVKNDILVKKEVVFFPYKVSMWDSLESIYLAAKKDPGYDAYCVPIPYYNINSGHNLGEMHYEGNEYPEDIEIIDWQSYNFEERKPDVIYIHNPYDDCNLVTSVHPRYYSSNLKKYTDTLVYIPYYSIFGRMSKAQSLCPAYIYADYIVIQASQFRKYFDLNIPDCKFLPFGSPKFDRIIKKCQNPPEFPEEWKAKMADRKVYFYNTSISGMLTDTETFLKKMNYVFQCFEGREDACLLWRPHPLLETTFDSMRPQYRHAYDALKQMFLDKDIGILDTTADIDDTIALSDAYIGDAGTSVTSLFGVAGKPVFILNNYIHLLPQKDDWRGERVTLTLDAKENNKYQITESGQLWFSARNDYHYEFYMDLENECHDGGRYMRAVELGDRIYVLPRSAHNILIIKDRKIEKIKKIKSENQILEKDAFSDCCYDEKYIFLLPGQYSKVIRFDIETEKMHYIDGIKQFYMRELAGEQMIGGKCFSYKNEIIFASPKDKELLFLDKATLSMRQVRCNSKDDFGIMGIIPDPYEDALWLTPMKGATIICWNLKTGQLREYSNVPENFETNKYSDEKEGFENPFDVMVFSRESGRENIVISPSRGNMYLTLDRKTGQMNQWDAPIDVPAQEENGYFRSNSGSGLIVNSLQRGKGIYRLWLGTKKRLYEVNIDTKEWKEIEVEYDYDDIKKHEPGFTEDLRGGGYYLKENALNSLKDFLDGNITGQHFDRELQDSVFKRINASPDGTCGKKICEFFREGK